MGVQKSNLSPKRLSDSFKTQQTLPEKNIFASQCEWGVIVNTIYQFFYTFPYIVLTIQDTKILKLPLKRTEKTITQCIEIKLAVKDYNNKYY